MNSSVCSEEINLYDSDSQYIKSACIVFENSIHSEACTPFGMEKFIVSSKKLLRDVLKFATNTFGHGRGSTLWINGLRGDDEKWYTVESVNHSQTEIKLFKNVFQNPKNEVKKLIYATVNENCLVVNALSEFKVRTWVCSSMLYSICEYIKPDAPKQLKPNTEICERTSHVHSRFKYFKSICLISQENYIYSDSEDACDANGMKLYSKGNETKSTEELAIKKLFVDRENVMFWVRENLPRDENYLDKLNEDCKVLSYRSSDRKKFRIRKEKCSKMFLTICEFNKSI